VCFVVLDSPLAYLDPVSCNMTYMFVQLFKDALNEYAYAAELAGMRWELTNTKYGMIVSTPVATDAAKFQYHDGRKSHGLTPSISHLSCYISSSRCLICITFGCQAILFMENVGSDNICQCCLL
jgi:hypothetical protein